VGRYRFLEEELLDPSKSEKLVFHIEDALDCDGVRCGTSHNIVGEPEIDPHHHLIYSGLKPKTSNRCIPFFGMPPDLVQTVFFDASTD
jgi:hypothetical protein